jgi:uncharacterized membrane protein
MTYLLKFKTENAEAKALLEYLQKLDIVDFIKPYEEDFTQAGNAMSEEEFRQMLKNAETQYVNNPKYTSEEVKNKLGNE